MEKCLDFASTSCTSILAYIQRKRDFKGHRVHLYTAYQGLRKVSFKTNENKWIVIEIFLPELNKCFEILLDEVKYVEHPIAAEYAKGKNIIFDVDVNDEYLTYPILPPELHDLPFNKCYLKCLECDSILANPNSDYAVEDVAAEEIMETAMGCCRCCCSSSAAVTKCAHLRPALFGRILIDDGIVLITEKYLKEGSYMHQINKPLIECMKCDLNSKQKDLEYFGFQRSPSNYIEIIPMKADFFDENGKSLLRNAYKCWGSYFASLLIPNGFETYIMVTDGCINPVIQLGYFFRRLLWLGDSSTYNVKKVTVLCFFYTENLQITSQKLTPKIRLPVTLIQSFKEYLKKSHEIYKPFNAGCGEWKAFSLFLP